MDESVRLARIEAKLDQFIDLLERIESSQAKHNDLFYMTRDKVNDMDSRQKGAWFIVGIFSAAVSFLVSLFNK
jgi:hypothetical protein